MIWKVVGVEAEESGDADSVLSNKEAELFDSATKELVKEKLRVMTKLENETADDILDCERNGVLVDLTDDVNPAPEWWPAAVKQSQNGRTRIRCHR